MGEALSWAINYDGDLSAWPGVNGEKGADEQSTTMMHSAHGRVLTGGNAAPHHTHTPYL